MDNILVLRFLQGPEQAVVAVTWIVIVAFSICVHEMAHAWVAYKEGDDTAVKAGHLSLNPLVQMGPMSILILLVIGIAWGAVPVARERFRHRYSNAWVSFAGPLANIILMIIFSIFYALTLKFIPIPETLAELTVHRIGELGCSLNAVLFVLNMLPIPILDGWHVYSYFFPQMDKIDPARAQTFCMMALIIIFMSPTLGGLLWGSGYLATAGLTDLWLAIINAVVPS